MNISPDSTNPADTRPLDPDPTGQDPSATDSTAKVKMLLQSVIFEVTREAGGRSLPEIRDMLQAGFARRGVEAPTNIWLDSVASAAFYGEPYIIDLPAALAADSAVAAPNDEVRQRLASRRELRKEQLPVGTFPADSAWKLDDNEVTGRAPEAGRPNTRAALGSRSGMWRLLAAAAVGASVLVGIAAIRAATTAPRKQRRPHPGRP